MQKKVLRLLCLVLALLMLGSVFVSCKKNDTDGETTTASTTAGETNLHQSLGIEIRDYTGEQMKIWYSNQEGNKWSAYPLDVELEDTEVDIIYKAGYQRNQEMKQRIGVEVSYTINNDDPINDATPLRMLRQAGDIGNYDLVLAQMQAAGTLALEDFFVDLELSPHINADAYYYESSLNEQIKIGKKQYFALGYYSWGNTAATTVTYVNMGIIEDKTGTTKEELYQMVLDKKFTLDAMLELGRAYIQPETGNDDYEKSRVAYLHPYNYAASLFYNLGGEAMKYNESQNKYEVVIREATNVQLLSEIRDKIGYSTECMMVRYDKELDSFMAECAPFAQMTNYNIELLNANTIVDKTIFLPPAILNEGDDYRAFTQPHYMNAAGIPIDTAIDSEKFDRAGYLYEFFMIACYEMIYPAVYEQSFRTRYQPDEISREVFDLCQSSKTTCMVYAYDLLEDTTVSCAIRSSSSANVATREIERAVKSNLEELGLNEKLLQ